MVEEDRNEYLLNKKLGIALVLYTLTFATAYATTAEPTPSKQQKIRM
jgi:hypothetical protein